MRTALIGTTDLTRAIFDAMVEAGCEIAAVVTGPETFAISYERKGVHNVRHADLRSLAAECGIPCYVYDGSRTDLDAFLRECRPDFGLAAGWYHIIAESTRALFPLGCAGFHASLLPKFRGGAPLNWAILSGEKETGVSMFLLGAEVDDGPLFGQERFPIFDGDYIGDLVQRCEDACRTLVKRCLPTIAAGSLAPRPQQGMATFGLQRRPSDSEIDWTGAADAIARLVRASSRPYAGAYSILEDCKIKIWRASAVEKSKFPVVLGQCGQVFLLPGFERPLVLCGEGALVLEEVSDTDGVDLAVEAMKWGHRRFRTRPLV